MSDKEYYWQCFNPRHWDKDTWIGGALCITWMALSYFAIMIFH